MKRVIVVLACVLLLSACTNVRPTAFAEDAGLPVRGGTLKLVAASDLDHLATTSSYSSNGVWFVHTFARQLVTYPAAADFDTASKVVADLAETLPTTENGGISQDGLTYIFHLRHGVWWNTSPKREVVAGDIVRGMKFICNPVNPSGAPGYYLSTIMGMPEFCDAFARVPGVVADLRQFVETHDLPGVRVTDDYTVTIRLQAPAPDFLNLLAMPFASPIPIEYLNYLPDGPEFRQHTISNGPYQITKYTQNHEIFLERNPVWDSNTDPVRPAYVDRMSINLGIDNQLVQLQLEAGTADLSFSDRVPVSELAALLQIGDTNLTLAPPGDRYGALHYLSLNTVDPNNNGAMQKLAVRQALAYAVDKAAIVQDWGGPRVARPARQAVPNTTSGFKEGADQFVTPNDRGDPERTRQLLADAGYPNGLSLKLVYAIDSQDPMDAQAVQASFKRAGIQVELIPFTTGDFYSRLLPNPENARRGAWDIAIATWYPDWFGSNNGRSVIEPLFDGRHFGLNSMDYGGYNNPIVNTMIDRATNAPTADGSQRIWTEAVQRITEDVAIIPLIEQKNANYHSSRTKGCVISIFNLNCDLTAVWLKDGK